MKRVVKTPFPEDPLLVDARHLGLAVRAARTSSGQSLPEAALALGVAKQTLADLESGKATVALGTALRVARELGVSLFVAPAEHRARIQALVREASR
jgi:transcriptional regulator with XRE-family HTH domain